MGAMSVRLPESVQSNLKEFSKVEGISINQFIVNAINKFHRQIPIPLKAFLGLIYGASCKRHY
jgi:hypothetical protein